MYNAAGLRPECLCGFPTNGGRRHRDFLGCLLRSISNSLHRILCQCISRNPKSSPWSLPLTLPLTPSGVAPAIHSSFSRSFPTCFPKRTHKDISLFLSPLLVCLHACLLASPPLYPAATKSHGPKSPVRKLNHVSISAHPLTLYTHTYAYNTCC